MNIDILYVTLYMSYYMQFFPSTIYLSLLCSENRLACVIFMIQISRTEHLQWNNLMFIFPMFSFWDINFMCFRGRFTTEPKMASQKVCACEADHEHFISTVCCAWFQGHVSRWAMDSQGAGAWGLLLPPLVLKMCTCTFNVCSHLCNIRAEERTEGMVLLLN